MALPTPDLDDRRFQELVDDAKRMVQQRCPEWTDHNVSDPGVTLIETVAFMVDQLFYRLNRVPDRLYVTFLDLIGLTLHAPTAARAEVTFWLSAPQPDDVSVPAGSEVATQRTETDEAIVFATTDHLTIPPRQLSHLATQTHTGETALQDLAWRDEAEITCFTAQPVPGDALMFGLSDAAPGCAVVLRLDCAVHGVGVDPRHPPLVWEGWDGSGWRPCDVDRDATGGLNRAGDIVLHVPQSHVASVTAGERAGWLRCRAVTPLPDLPFYSSSPTLRAAEAFVIGGTVQAVHAETVRDEVLGLSEGVPGQRFSLARVPVVIGGPPVVVEVAAGHGWEAWTNVDSFAGAGVDATVFRLDHSTGEVQFGPAVRTADGGFEQFGAVPPKGAPLRVPAYRHGGGPDGNVARRAIHVQRTTVPFVERVENRRPAFGGVAGETVDEAKIRGPIALRTRDRAVTVEDYEQLARQAAPDIARVRCVPAGEGSEPGEVRLLLVPAAPVDSSGRLRFEDLRPPEQALVRVTDYLDDRRLVGTRLVVSPPFYQGVTVVARLTARLHTPPELLRSAALDALFRHLNPLVGGPAGNGWPFGRPVQAGEIFAVLQSLPGTEMVEEVLLFAADPVTGQHGEPVQRIDLDRHATVFSFEHQVRATTGE